MFPSRENMVGAGHNEMPHQWIVFGTKGGEPFAEIRDIVVSLDLESRDVESDISFRHVDLGAICPEAFANIQRIFSG